MTDAPSTPLAESTPAARQAPRAFHLLAKPTGAACNLDCKYCFFLSKETLYPGSNFRMADDLLGTYISQLLGAHRGPVASVNWQGGEPTLMGLDFFRHSVELVDKHKRPDQKIAYTLQTNGVLLDDAWCRFLKQNNFLVGISIDGPKACHDAYRINKGGRGTFDQVMHGLHLLKSHGVDFNILCTVHAANGDSPLDIYRFFRDELGARHIQFIPIVERATAQTLPMANKRWGERVGVERQTYTQSGSVVTERSVAAVQYGRFLTAVFDEWVQHDVGTVFVQTFDVALGSWLGQHNLCVVSPTCGNSLALEHNGDLYSCDHYVEPEHLLGNIRQTPIADLVASDKQRKFGCAKFDSLPQYCRSCEVMFACYGDCPRNRFIDTPDGEPGLNYLCEGYRLFYGHIREAMTVMANLHRAGRYADEVMDWFAAKQTGPGQMPGPGIREASSAPR